MKIEGFLSNVHQLDRSTTFRVLVRFQNSWYLFCLARSETFENGNYNSEIDDLPTLRGVTVKRFSGKTIFGKMARCTSRSLYRCVPGYRKFAQPFFIKIWYAYLILTNHAGHNFPMKYMAMPSG